MQQSLQERIRELNNKHRKSRTWQKLVNVMACVVVFVTTYALILPAITMETTCGVEEHIHTMECYEEGWIFPEEALVCELPEIIEHVHTEECYREVILTVSDGSSVGALSEGTVSGSDAMTSEGVMLDTVAASTGSVSGSDAAGAEDASDTDGTTSTIVIAEDGTAWELICEIPEETIHEHTLNCYETSVLELGYGLICGLEEHEHTLACWSDETADVENEYNWESTFADVELTGVWTKDVLLIAETQLGYAESTKNYEVEEDGETLRGYTRYGQWYGDAYEDWGAMFVSFCLYYAQTAMPLDNDAQGWIEVLASESYDLYREAGAYTPIPGDIIFFADEEGRGDDHVGFVYQMTGATETEPATIMVIEGNTAEGKVELVTYAQSDAAILGYGDLQAAQMLMGNTFGIMTLEEVAATDGVLAYEATATGTDYFATIHYGYADVNSVPSNQVVTATVTENTTVDSEPYTTYKATIESSLESNRALGDVLRVFDVDLSESVTDTYTFDMLVETNGSKGDFDYGYNYEDSLSDTGALEVNFTNQYGEIRYYLPEDINPANIQSVTFNYNTGMDSAITEKLAYKIHVNGEQVAINYGTGNTVEAAETLQNLSATDVVTLGIMFNAYNWQDLERLDDVVIDSITITTDPSLTTVSPAAPMDNAEVDITLNGVTGAEWNVMAFKNTNGTYTTVSPDVTTTVANNNTTVSFATDSLEGYEAYAVYNTVKTSSEQDGLHISFGGANTKFAASTGNIATRAISNLTANTGDYTAVAGAQPVFGALTGNINVESTNWPYVRFLFNNEGISYTIKNNDKLYVRLRTADTNGKEIDLGGLEIAINYPITPGSSDNTETLFVNPTVSELAPDGYRIYEFDIGSLAGQVPNFICVRWRNASIGTVATFAMDYLSIRSEELNTNHFQTHFSSTEYSPLMTLDAWGAGKGTTISSFDSGALQGIFSSGVGSYYSVETVKDESYSLNYVIQEGDVLQFRVNTNNANTLTNFNGYKIVIGGKDFPLKNDSSEQTGGGGRYQKDAPNHKGDTGFISQSSYEVVSIDLSDYAGKTIDWVEFRWKVSDDADWTSTTDVPNKFKIDHIRIGQLALTAYDHGDKKFDTSATPLDAASTEHISNIVTEGEDTIDFKLFDYSQALTATSASNGNAYGGINDNGLFGYFEFRGRSFNDNPGNMRNTNSGWDADGYVDTYYTLVEEGVTGSDALVAYHFNKDLNVTTDGYLYRRTKVLPVLSGENRNGYPQLDGTIHELVLNGNAANALTFRSADGNLELNEGDTLSITESVLADMHGKSLGYLFGAGGTGVTSYDPKNTILQYNPNTGLYWYDSAKNAVDYNKTTSEFYVRNYIERSDTSAENVENNLKGDTSGKTYGDFLPFTYWGGETQYYVDDNPNNTTFFYDGDYEQNYWFGMTMETHFYQPPAGINPLSGDEMVFNFSGDDDIWVFVDGVLVLDLGGTHGITSGSINFATGEITQYLNWPGEDGAIDASRSYATTLQECFANAGVTPEGGWQNVTSAQTYGLSTADASSTGTAQTFADYSEHTFTFYYLERGTSVSNCSMEFNLLTISEESLIIGKSLADENENEWSSIYDSELEYQFRLYKAEQNANGEWVSTEELFAPAGTPYTVLETNEVRYVDNDGYFYLKANEFALFEFAEIVQELTTDPHYVIVEFLPVDINGQYAGISTVTAQVTSSATGDGNGEYEGPSLSAGEFVQIEYVNKIDTTKLSTLSITKDVEVAEDANKQFEFLITLDGNPLHEGATCQVTDANGNVSTREVTVTKDAAGNVIESTVIINANETILFEGILAGTKYKVQETTALTEVYSVEYTVTSSGESGVYSANNLTYIEGVTDINDDVVITITNRKKGIEVTIPMTKTLTNPDGSEAEYTFLLEQVADVNGTAMTDGTSLKATVSYTGEEEANAVKDASFLLDYPSTKLPGTFYYKITEIPIVDGVTVYDESEYIVEIIVTDAGSDGYNVEKKYYKDGMEVTLAEGETISFVNSLGGAILPNTGGRGPTTYYAIGGLLMMASLIYLGLIRRRKRKGG